jgi:hypothetical protein
MDTFNYPSLELPKIGVMEQVTCSREAVLILGSVDEPTGPPRNRYEADLIPAK